MGKGKKGPICILDRSSKIGLHYNYQEFETSGYIGENLKYNFKPLEEDYGILKKRTTYQLLQFQLLIGYLRSFSFELNDNEPVLCLQFA